MDPLIVISSKQEYRLNEKVTMVCDSNSTDGSLDCKNSFWNKDGQVKIVQNDNQLEFLMQRSTAGNYTCRCQNSCWDISEISKSIGIILIETGKISVSLLLSYRMKYLKNNNIHGS